MVFRSFVKFAIEVTIMRGWSFPESARRAVTLVSRRAALGPFGVALAALAAGSLDIAARKKKKLCKGDNQKCHRQVEEFCDEVWGGQSACVSELFACCGQTARRCKGVPKFLNCCDQKGWECSAD